MEDHEIIERHLVVLFGLIRAFKMGCHINWFWSTVSRLWLNLPISSQDQNQRIKDLVEDVVRARGHDGFYYNPTSSAPAAKTHLGKLIDDWAQHRGDNRHFFVAENPAPTAEENKDFKDIQDIVAAAIKKRPLGVFSHNDKHEVTGWPRAAPAAVVPCRDIPVNAPASLDDDEGEIQDSNIHSVKAMYRELAAGRIAAEVEAIELYKEQAKNFREHAKHSQEQVKLYQEHAKLSQEQSTLVQQLVKNAQQLDANAKKADENAQKLDKNAQKLDKTAERQDFIMAMLVKMARQQKGLDSRISSLEE
ncbi:hypothetical protein PG991_012872 [Apiospora marii]|uniref:Uncharacterized protein n=1 Tax=Apiospora marii TaxID=335849 RepID=A0ABR1RB40_9PEZI